MISTIEAFTIPSVGSFGMKSFLHSPSSSMNIGDHRTFSSFTPIKLSMSENSDEISDKQRAGKNWIEKSSPTGISLPSTNEDESSTSEPADYTLGIDGESFSLGPLSVQVYEALISVASKRFPSQTIPSELEDIYKVYAMDLAAKEATQLALKQNGLQFDVMSQNMKEDSEEEIWGELENIKVNGNVYESPDDAVKEGKWKPGQNFSFVVRNVRAKEKEIDIKELLASIDPDGSIRAELDSREEKPDYGYDPAENIKSLKDVAMDNEKRCNDATRDVNILGTVTSGPSNVIALEDIKINDDDSTAAIMEALESHTYLIVDLGNPSKNSVSTEQQSHPTQIINAMWKAIESFFANPSRGEIAPKMEVAPDAGSRHAVYGYTTYEDDAMQFLETRIVRQSGDEIIPKEIKELIGEDSVKDVIRAFGVIANIGKDITTIATAAASQEANAYTPDYNEDDAFEFATLMTNDLLDDGMIHPSTEALDTTVSMSPHRMCRYTASTSRKENLEEVFGAHTDTTFATVIPVAAVSGLEVFDADGREWTRPESIAREHWEAQLNSDESQQIPWHCRYLVIMSGELLQLSTRSMIPAAVHRVVAGGEPRLSAPVLLRARSKMVMDVEKYFGENVADKDNNEDVIGRELLLNCNEMTMEQIHDALQP